MEEQTYTTPLARWARIMEIFVPAYMFGKSWGIADEKTVDLFRATFPPFLIDAAEFIKGLAAFGGENLGRFYATSAGALVGFGVVVCLAVLVHLVVRDRSFVDSLRLTSVSLIPLAVLNGTVSHAVKTLVENLGTQSVEALTKSALEGPRTFLILNVCFYVIALWMMGRRTGVTKARRWGLVGVGLGFVVLYMAGGFMITPGEWEILLPKLQHALAQ